MEMTVKEGSLDEEAIQAMTSTKARSTFTAQYLE